MVFKDNFMNSPNKPHWLLPFIQYCQIQEYQVLKKKLSSNFVYILFKIFFIKEN